MVADDITGTSITSVTVTTAGSGYEVGDTLTVANGNIPGSSSDLVFTLIADDINATVITGVTVTTAGSDYAVGDTLTVANGNIPGSSSDLVFTLVADDITSTSISSVTVTTAGSGYVVGNTLTVANANLPGSSTDLVFTLVADDIVGTTVTAVTVTTAGSGYYTNDVLTISNTNIPGSASDLVFTLAVNDVIGTTVTSVTATTVGSSYKVGDTITVSKNDISSTSNLVFTLVANDIDATIVSGVTVTTAGSGYKVDDTITLASGNISGADRDVIFKLTSTGDGLVGSTTAYLGTSSHSSISVTADTDATIDNYSTGTEETKQLIPKKVFLKRNISIYNMFYLPVLNVYIDDFYTLIIQLVIKKLHSDLELYDTEIDKIYFEYRITPRRLNSSDEEEFPTNETELDSYLDLNLKQNTNSLDTTYNDSDNISCYDDKQLFTSKLEELKKIVINFKNSPILNQN